MQALRRALPAAWYRGARWLWLLRPVEIVFRSVAALRRELYRRGLLASYRAPVPVVIVGNICVGGSGKTPVVIALVEALQSRGIRPGVISRGYGADPGPFPRLVAQGSEVADGGDEALLVFRRTGCPCAISPRRADAARLLLEHFEVDLLISDDGLQHYALARDMEIALVDAGLGHGNGFCLPAGPLREPVSRLRVVDRLLYRGGGPVEDRVSYERECLVNLRSGEQRPVAPDGIGVRVHGLAGIGQPPQFFRDLRQAGFEVQEHPFPDHHRYRAADLAGLGSEPIIMTEKDAVKCAHLSADDAWYLKISARLPDTLPAAVAALIDN